ncbi:MAG: amino acid ABC transporter permease [Coriobacteriia bacterium]
MMRARILGLSALVALIGVLAIQPVALAVENAKVTLNEQTGGKSTRFTLNAFSGADERIDSVRLVFPKGFDLSKARFVTDELEGVKVTHMTSDVSVSGTTVDLALKTPLEPGGQLRVLMYDVITTFKGGSYTLGMTYTSGGAERDVPGLEFEYVTPPLWERLTTRMDRSSFVAAWNDVKTLNIFFKPQLFVEATFVVFVGWLTSIGLVAFAFPLAITYGLILAFMKMSKIALPRWIAAAYINVIRGTPLFLQIYVAFVGLRIAGLRMNDFLTGVIVLMLNSSAYLAEIFRAGIQSIHKGQFEAASSLGMTYTKTMRFVIIPQTVRRVLPTMTSEFILLFKDTALLFPVGVFELMMYSNQIVARSGNLTPFMVAAGYYLVVTIPLIHWVGKLEERLAVSERGSSVEKPKHRGGLFWRPVTAGPISELEVSAAEHESR